MPAIKVLYVHWGHEGIRGSERVLLDLFAELDRERVSPLLWCNSHVFAEAARSSGVDCLVDEMPVLFGWDPPRWKVRDFRALVTKGRQLIRRHRADIVHVTSGAPTQWMALAARSERAPLVAHLHAVYGFRDRTTLLLHQAPLIVGCSDAVVAPFREDGVPEARLRVVSNGVNVRRVNNGDARSLRRSLDISPEAIVVTGAGALVPLKGFATAIRALALTVQRGTDAHLILAGEGPERRALDRLAHELDVADRVHLLGQQPELGAVFRDATDIAVVTSAIESFGLVAAEAGAVAVPTIATRVGGIPEVVEDTVTGLLVRAGDATALADAICELAGAPERRRTMGEAARLKISSRFTTERVARAIEAIYLEMTSLPRESFGWRQLGFQVTHFVRFALAVAARRLKR